MPLSNAVLWDAIKHSLTWLANLRRAGSGRKAESVRALRGVVLAARETAVYLRKAQDTGSVDHDREAALARHWTELGFALEDLGIDKLAKRCQVTGKHLASPGHYSADYLAKADVGLDRMETLARQILKDVG